MKVTNCYSSFLVRAITLFLPSLLLVGLGGCRKEKFDFAQEDELVRLDAYRQVHYKEATKHSDNSFTLLLHSSGSSETVQEGQWLFFDFLSVDLDGFFLGSTIAQQAKDYGVYSSAHRYVPSYRCVKSDEMGSAFVSALQSVHVGDTLLVGLPSSLASQTKLWSGRANQSVLCWVVPQRVVSSPEEYERGQIESFLRENAGLILLDSVYREVLQEGDGKLVEESSKVWLDYTGYYLDGSVFDTNNEEKARLHGLYSAQIAYTPLSLKAKDDTKMIRGFSGITVGLKAGARIRVLIPSALAYGATGRGQIRPWEPLLFEITVVRAE